MGRKKGVILSYILMVIEVMSTLLLTPLIIKKLGQSEYGVYKLSASIVAYLALLDLGIGNSIVRFSAKYKANHDMQSMNCFLGISQIFYAVMSLVSVGIGIVLIKIFPSVFAVGLSQSEIVLGQTLLLITVLNIAVTMLTAPYPHIIVGYGLFGVSKGISIIQIIVRIVVTWGALVLGMKSISIVTINLVMTMIGRSAMTVYVYVKLKLKPTLQGINKSFVVEIIGYSGWIFLQMIATQINAYADQVLLGILVPGASIVIGVYTVGAQLVQYYQSIGGAVSGVLMPEIVSMVEKGADSKTLESEMIRIGRFSLVVLCTILGGFLAFGKQFISLWVGTEYSEGYYVAVILMIAWMFISTESIGSQILWAKCQHKEQSILKICTVMLNVVLTIFLIKWNPLIGATIGTFISLIFGDVVVMNIVFKRNIGISLRTYYIQLLKGILPAISISTIIAFIFRMLNLKGWIGLIINISFYCVVSAVSLMLFGINKNEKKYILGIFKKVIKN